MTVERITAVQYGRAAKAAIHYGNVKFARILARAAASAARQGSAQTKGVK